MNEKGDYGFVLFDTGISLKGDLTVESNPKFILKIFIPMAIHAYGPSLTTLTCVISILTSVAVTALSSLETRACTHDVIRGP